MALIKCPECGKKNVSDSAESCPECGYGIKAHYDKITKQKQQQNLYEMRMNNIKEPQKPKADIYGMIICGVGGVGSLLIYGSELLAIGIATFIILLIVFIVFYNQHVKAMKQYKSDCELYRTDRKAYQRQVIQREEFHKIMEDAKPKCPHCKSTNIERISTIDRALSVGTVGLASNKIGKQYKCKNCKQMW